MSTKYRTKLDYKKIIFIYEFNLHFKNTINKTECEIKSMNYNF